MPDFLGQGENNQYPLHSREAMAGRAVSRT